MEGYQLTLFFQETQHHAHRPLADWLVETARKLGVAGCTVLRGEEGFGRSRRLHLARFFELAEQPVEVTMALSADELVRFMETLRTENVKVFYVKVPVEYGIVGD
ncbi:hypothetical protein PTE30175_04277 [Pandoraea terrae]|uniref:Uncharacterized protein n=1 Tax=Pandoraea terrae TaxID=1537710 RepID=A0A5E4YA65_9BURK|nr:DUF190 domain-containing protein [Pandoraea terrae]VVE45317.1 hypothetical protein PTE30175_04277 [Pandoraea terrae]